MLSEEQSAELERIRGWACCQEPELRFMAEIKATKLERVARIAKMLQDDPHWAHSYELEAALADLPEGALGG